ncbi:Beta-lactamase/transpeptidase-like protein [Naviculisporaceae sp. PSN 640]
MVSAKSFLLSALAVTANGLAPPQHSKPLPPHLKAKLDDAFATAVGQKRVPGITALALNRDGSVIYNNSFGTIKIDDPTSPRITSNTKMAIASMTKAVVSVAALQLVEQHKLSLDDLVERYIPSWANLSVLTGFAASGEPILRPPKSKAKVIHLVTHTGGAPYPMVNDLLTNWTSWAATQPNPPAVPLAADPGTGWFYGTNTDTLGHIVETISGLRLDAYINKHIFGPLGISPSSSGLLAPEIWSHRRQDNGTIIPSATPPAEPADDPFGGGYLTSTISDYADFLLPLLNQGSHPISGVRILSTKTAKKYLFHDFYPAALSEPGYYPGHEAGDGIGNWISRDANLTNSAVFLPGIKKGWSSAWLLNLQDVPGRRRKGSGTWAGIMNTYYWVDQASGKLGIIMTNLLPFLDQEVLGLFDLLEEAVYKA